MSYLFRIPIHVLSKKSYTKKPYRKDKWFKGYAELNMRRNGAIEFNLRIGNNARDYKIAVSKWALFQMFLFHLSLRPIWQTKEFDDDGNRKFWADPRIEQVVYEDIDHVPISKVIEDYDEAVDHLQMIIPTMTGDHKEHAERQMEQLLGRQWKIDLLRQIQLSNEMKSNALPEQ